MTDTTTTKPPTAAAASTPRQRGTARPTVSVRPAAVGAVNAATIAGATVVAAGGGAILAAGAGVLALGATAVGARKKGKAAGKREHTITFSRSATGSTGRGGGGGGLGRVGRSAAGSPGSRSAGSRAGAGRGAGGSRGGAGSPTRGGGLLPKLRRSSGGGADSGRSAAAGRTRRGSTGGGSGHRRSGSTPGSSRGSLLTADKVAAARRKLANRRQPGPRLSDAIRSAVKPATTPQGAPGKKPTAREAFTAARRAVTGDNPKRRGTVRRATAGLVAGGLAAGKAAYDSRQRRKRRDAARQAKTDRIAARQGRQEPRVGTAVRRAADATDTTSRTRKPAPAPLRGKPGPFKGTIVAPRDTTCRTCDGPVLAGEWAYPAADGSVIGPCCGCNLTAKRPTTHANFAEGRITMTHPLLAISEDFLAAAARNQPEGMLQVTAEAHLLPQVMENIVRAMKIRFDRAQDHPLHPSIKEMYGLVHKAQVAVQQAAEEIGPAIEKVHEHELNRLRNQRVGEDMWDVARNRGQL